MVNETGNRQTESLRIGLVVGALVLAVAVLAVLHLLTQWGINRASVEDIIRTDLPTYRARFRLLHLDREMSVTAWFSSLLITINAVLLGLVAWAHHMAGRKGAKRWAVAGLICLGLSADETAAIHENLGPRVGAMMGGGSGYLEHAGWVVPALVLVALVAAVYLPLLWRLPVRTRWGFVAAAGTFVFGAAGLEIAASLVMEGQGDPPLQNPLPLSAGLIVVEECLEMLAMVILAGTLLDLLRPRVSLALRGAEEAAGARDAVEVSGA